MLSAVVLAGCNRAGAAHTAPPTSAPIRVAECTGPATSLPDSLARRLPPRTGRMVPDDKWADLANTIPGGFAGVFRDSAHTQILMLTRPAEADAAQRALVGRLDYAWAQTTVRQARWDFAQLVDWFNYIFPRLTVGPVAADKDEVLNRIHFTVTSVERRDYLVRELAMMSLPCDLVVIDVKAMTVRLTHQQ